MKQIIFLSWLIAVAAFPGVAHAKPVSPKTFTFDCVGDSGVTPLTVAYLGQSRARISLGAVTVTATHSVSADGALFVADDMEFWNKGDDAVVEWRGDKLKCSLRKSYHR